MVSDKKIEEVRKQIQKSINEQPMVIDNEPQHSGDPINTIQQDLDELEDKNGKK